MSAATGATLGRRELIVIALLWAAMAGAVVIGNWAAINGMTMPDPDDDLRLQQVRDWLAGQGWFDVTQHRVNPPVGGALHWSRVVDLPLAAGIALLTPLFGQASAETIVAVAAPLMIMGLAMLLAAAITARLVGRAWAPVAAMWAPLSAIASTHVAPLRVDHHGWQLVIALGLLWALIDETHKRRSGALAGAAAALWLNISIEGLPIVTCAALILGVRWLADGREAGRLQAYLWSLTISSAVLETITMPNAWSVAECDRVSQPYLLAFVTASAMAAAAGLPFMRKSWRPRLVLSGAAAAATAAAFVSMGSQCLAGPFADLDPLTRTLWLDHVAESTPLMKLGPSAIIASLGFAATGCVGAAVALAGARGEARLRWITVLALALVSAALMLALARAGSVAHGFAAPGAAFVGRILFERARALEIMPLRVLATVLALLAATPALFRPLLLLDKQEARASERLYACDEIESLNDLSPSVLLAPLDIGPRVLTRTPHSVVATGHHRNHAAMNNVIAAFTGSPDTARALIAAHTADYVALCAAAPEIRYYQAVAPDGFAARLVSGRAPAWLHPIEIAPAGSGFLVFAVDPAVRNDELRGRLALASGPLRAS